MSQAVRKNCFSTSIPRGQIPRFPDAAAGAATGRTLKSRSRPLPTHPGMKYFRKETLAVDKFLGSIIWAPGNLGVWNPENSTSKSVLTKMVTRYGFVGKSPDRFSFNYRQCFHGPEKCQKSILFAIFLGGPMAAIQPVRSNGYNISSATCMSISSSAS